MWAFASLASRVEDWRPAMGEPQGKFGRKPHHVTVVKEQAVDCRLAVEDRTKPFDGWGAEGDLLQQRKPRGLLTCRCCVFESRPYDGLERAGRLDSCFVGNPQPEEPADLAGEQLLNVHVRLHGQRLEPRGEYARGVDAPFEH